MELAVKNLDRLRQLIRDLVDVSRIERGLFGVQARPTDVVAIVRETADLFTGGETPIELVLDQPVTACCDCLNASLPEVTQLGSA